MRTSQRLIHQWHRVATLVIACCAVALAGRDAHACTAFCAVGQGQVLVGNNEDWTNPRTKLWFVPAASGTYGRMYVGFDDLYPQGGMNERGLWFDGFAAPPIREAGRSNLPRYDGNIVDKAMAECSTVDEVVRLFSQYERAFLAEGILMFADASGDAVSIERNAIVRKTRGHFVQTNFHQSLGAAARIDGRYDTATTMLEAAGDDISVDLFRRILAATHQKGGAPTLYSNIYDLRARTMHLYYFHDFARVVTFQLDDELRQGARVLDIPALFPPNATAAAFAARQIATPQTADARAFMASVAAIVIAVLAAASYALLRGGRRVRIGIATAGALMALLVALIVTALRMHAPRAAEWNEFSIGPASGQSFSFQPTVIRSSGIPLRTAIGFAYEIHPVRVIGPQWLDTRYSLRAAVEPDAADTLRLLLRKELTRRLQLATRRELRPFDVLVLTASAAPRLERAQSTDDATSIQARSAQLRNASMETLAAALQGILGTPVVDETGITGSYNLELEWSDDRVASMSTLLHDRFGLRLSPATRTLEALVVDDVQRDPALVLLAEIGRVSRHAPASVRQHIASAFAIP